MRLATTGAVDPSLRRALGWTTRRAADTGGTRKMGRWLTRFSVVVATVFGVGFAPVAPGTFGTLAALPLFYFGAAWPLSVRLAALSLLIAVAILSAHRAGRHFGEHDSGHIVIDEVAGFAVATVLLPFSWPALIVAFVAFRVFDIFKPWPASYFDRHVSGGFGVVADDLVAGLYAGVCTFAAMRLG